MNYHELKYILCIAKYQNLTKAAQELYISQPTLTKHLQKLEREMGTKLFSRSGNSYTPTFAGRKYMEYTRKILQIQQDWEKELKDLTENNEGELNVAFPLMRSTCMVPQIMTSFFQKYPLAAAGSVSTHGIYPKLDLSLLAEEPFILHFPEQTTGQLSLEALKAAHIKPYVPIQSRNTETCVKLCMQGLGMCFTPETYVQNMDLPVKPACFSIGEDGVFSTLTIAYRRGTYLPQYARDFICTARTVL